MKEKKTLIVFMLSLPFSCVTQPVIIATSTPSASISSSPSLQPTIQPTQSTVTPTTSPVIQPTTTPSNSTQPTTIPTIQPTSYPLPSNTDYDRKIIYTSNFENGFNLYSINSDGSESNKVTFITDSPGDVVHYLSITPDGKKVFYTSDYSLYQINIDGSDKKTVLFRDGNISKLKLSRDGKILTFSSNQKIYTYNIDLQQLKKIDIKGESPSLSPDVKKIIFSYNLGNLEFPNSQLFISDIDGTGLKRVTNDKNMYYNPTWLPDGSKIIIEYSNLQTQKGGIYSIDPDGNNLKFITDKSDKVKISPDGKHLAYRDGKSNIFICDTNGANVNLIIESQKIGSISEYVWSPDSKKILFYENDFKIVNIENKDIKIIAYSPIKYSNNTNVNFYPSLTLEW